MDAPVSPVRVLVREANGECSELGVDGWSASLWRGCLCPVPADSLSMPSEHGVWFDDQKRVMSTCPSHCRPEKGEDSAVDVSELWSVDLALQDQELMSEGEDLCVTGVAGGEYPSEPVDNKANQSRKQGHERRRLPASAIPETRGITARTNLRHARGQGRRRA